MSHADQPDPRAEIDELEADIEQTARSSAETVAALTDKLDVKGPCGARGPRRQGGRQRPKVGDTAKDNAKDVCGANCSAG